MQTATLTVVMQFEDGDLSRRTAELTTEVEQTLKTSWSHDGSGHGLMGYDGPFLVDIQSSKLTIHPA